MGLMRTSDEELARIFEPEITNYLKKQILVETPGVKQARPPVLSRIQPDDDELISMERIENKRPTPSFMSRESVPKHTPLAKLLPAGNRTALLDDSYAIQDLDFEQDSEEGILKFNGNGKVSRQVKNLSQPYMTMFC